MALSFQVAHIDFPSYKGYPMRASGSVTFSSNVRTANIALQSFDIGYTGKDHHLLRTAIKLTLEQTAGATVRFSVGFLLRDSSGDIDDAFEGKMDVLVIADLEDTPQVNSR
jgi:hypothetical protein